MLLARGMDQFGNEVWAGGKTTQAWQKWKIIYADEYTPSYKKGELNPDFGLYVEREFSIITKMQSGRYMDLVDNGVVVKRRNGLSTQKWYFDDKTKTIKSVAYTGKSMHISPTGSNRDLRIHSTSSKWF